MYFNFEKLLASLHSSVELDMGRDVLRGQGHEPRIQKVKEVGAVAGHGEGAMGNLDISFSTAVLAGHFPALRPKVMGTG